jgi:cytochrome c oxidase subunit 3
MAMADTHGAHVHTQKHPYHLVDPSPWPFVGGLSALMLAIGFISFMHGSSIWWIAPGILGVAYTMLVWWRDVIKEAHQGHHTPVVQLHLRYGMILFIASEVMFFLAWFWAFFDASLAPGDPNITVARYNFTGGEWPPEGYTVFNPWHFPLLNTLILLTSGTTVTWAHHALQHGNRRGLIAGLTATVLLGATFTAVQAYEYAHATFSFGGSIFGATFFMATGFHGFHVLVGTIFLIVCLVRAIRGDFTPKQHFGFEAAAWYWHFVDVVWLFLFTFVYVWASWGAPMH